MPLIKSFLSLSLSSTPPPLLLHAFHGWSRVISLPSGSFRMLRHPLFICTNSKIVSSTHLNESPLKFCAVPLEKKKHTHPLLIGNLFFSSFFLQKKGFTHNSHSHPFPPLAKKHICTPFACTLCRHMCFHIHTHQHTHTNTHCIIYKA